MQLYLKVLSHIYILKWHIAHCWIYFARIYVKNSLIHLAFPGFSFVNFHWKITWYFGKVNKKIKTERISCWTDAQFTRFNVRPCSLSKTNDKLLLQNFYHLTYDIQKNVSSQRCSVNHYLRNMRIVNHYSHFKMMHNE